MRIIIYKQNIFSGFGPDPTTSKFELYGSISSPLRLNGKYDVAGRVLILPVQGKGDSEITLNKVKLQVQYTMKVEERDGKKYAQVDQLKFDFTPSSMKIKLENLFNGDKLLGDTTNLFLNENWHSIFLELKPEFVKAFGDIVKRLINGVFQKLPYETAFLQ